MKKIWVLGLFFVLMSFFAGYLFRDCASKNIDVYGLILSRDVATLNKLRVESSVSAEDEIEYHVVDLVNLIGIALQNSGEEPSAYMISVVRNAFESLPALSDVESIEGRDVSTLRGVIFMGEILEQEKK